MVNSSRTCRQQSAGTNVSVVSMVSKSGVVRMGQSLADVVRIGTLLWLVTEVLTKQRTPS
jgi:hypothetical protein